MQRIGTLILAIVFLVSTIGVGLYAIFANNQQTKDQQVQAELQKALAEQQKQQSGQEQIKVEEGKLQGSQLQNFTPVTTVTELKKEDILEGTGAVVKPGDTVTAHYTGALASTGQIFQSSLDNGSPIPFSLNGVIKGWTDGVPGMKVGGKRRLIIPSELAYGANPPQGSGIPANSPLVFDIEIVKIGQ